MIATFFLPGRVCATKAIREIARKTTAKYTMICLKPEIEWVYLGQERMIQVLEMTGADMAYSDHFAKINDVVTEAPVIDYQAGALRDDFDFGAVMLWRTDKLRENTRHCRRQVNFPSRLLSSFPVRTAHVRSQTLSIAR